MCQERLFPQECYAVGVHFHSKHLVRLHAKAQMIVMEGLVKLQSPRKKNVLSYGGNTPNMHFLV